MGLFEKIFGAKAKPDNRQLTEFALLSGYQPRFSTFTGSIYESELIRAVINARATHISKLRVEMQGAARPALQNRMKHAPNQFQTWGQFLYRLSTILDIHNSAFIIPVFDEFGDITGIYSPVPDRCTIVQYEDVPYLRYEFAWGKTAAIELALCGIMTKHQYRNDFFGESNKALLPTMDLISIQNQGIEEGVKSSATYRFIATLSNFAKPEDIAAERKRFSEQNLSKDAEAGGVLLFPNTYKDVKQVDSKPFVVDADQMRLIKDNVFEYFGVNEDILTNKAYGDAWTAFYEGGIEPFAIQFSEVVTKMLFTLREQTQGNQVIATANRLQYLSNAEKLNVSSQMADRGLMTRNEIREIWNLAPLPDPVGNQLPVRGEYYNVGEEGDDHDSQND